MSDVKNPGAKGTGHSNGLSFASGEQRLQIASRGLPDKQLERAHDRSESKDASLRRALPVMCTAASWRRGLRLCGLWTIQTGRLRSKLSCAMTRGNANQLLFRESHFCVSLYMKIIWLEQGFLYKVERIILKGWNLSVSWRNGQNGLQSAVWRWDNVQQALFFFFFFNN